MGYPYIIGALRGATTYGVWIWRLTVEVPYWRFLRVGCLPRVYWDNTDAED